ncbi:hypothetical protein BDP81DRAFT_219769 [Colletotrichum phormii]|uniref:Uncharacterized protein n=1 Tax=Colletotrichum phormii TaxID=359342 RepID=A0AAI9ZS56_9PEZI|nr:uncharacterized protein BDP81DRAFT_219769 [Colletotrichum phormii]KAK1637174.1 hypothetical protein BDP81DRAFT_219769 [Colletotrichum phormii]
MCLCHCGVCGWHLVPVRLAFLGADIRSNRYKCCGKGKPPSKSHCRTICAPLANAIPSSLSSNRKIHHESSQGPPISSVRRIKVSVFPGNEPDLCSTAGTVALDTGCNLYLHTITIQVSPSIYILAFGHNLRYLLRIFADIMALSDAFDHATRSRALFAQSFRLSMDSTSESRATQA